MKADRRRQSAAARHARRRGAGSPNGTPDAQDLLAEAIDADCASARSMASDPRSDALIKNNSTLPIMVEHQLETYALIQA
jgi:hypothetical protein